MRLIFMGSAEIAIPSLTKIISEGKDDIVGVITQPDRPAGRKRKLTPCPLKSFAIENNLPVFTPEKVGKASFVEKLKELKPELYIVAAYGQYIPSKAIDIAPHKAINLHPSLLPKYRGAAPIQWSILNGDTKTGVSIIYVDKRMDAGDILKQKEFPIDENDTSLTLHDKLANFGATLLLETMDDIRNNCVQAKPQDESQVVEVRKLSKEDSPIDWTLSSKEIRNRIRAFDPWPGTTCVLPSGDILKIWSAEICNQTGQPGEALDEQLLIATGNGSIRLTEVQPAGKKRMQAADFLRGHPIPKGSVLS